MWNAMKTKSLAGAILISATINGALLRGLNDMATAGAVSSAQAATAYALPTVAQPAPDLRYVTLEPVLVVGKRIADTDEHLATVTSALTSDYK